MSVYRYPVILPTTGTSGSFVVYLPFEAEFIGVLNNTGATISITELETITQPSDAISVQASVWVGIPINKTQKVTVFWSSTSTLNTSNNQAILLFSPQRFDVQSSGGVTSAVTVSGTPNVNVSNFPATQPISGSVSVSNLPATQPVSGSVSVSNFPASQTVSGSVSVSNFPSTQTVQSGTSSTLNITATTLVKAGAGRLVRVNVIVAGSAVGSANDAATTGGAATANEIFAIPNTVGTYSLDFPCTNGIVITPGTGQTVAVSYS